MARVGSLANLSYQELGFVSNIKRCGYLSFPLLNHAWATWERNTSALPDPSLFLPDSILYAPRTWNMQG